MKDDHYSLQSLVAALGSLNTAPSLQQIYEWLEKAKISREELQPYIAFKDGNYWRHRVCRNEFVEMLVLCWRPGQRTPIHDHNGSHGGVKIFEGLLWETTFTYDAEAGLGTKRSANCEADLSPVLMFPIFINWAIRMLAGRTSLPFTFTLPL